MRIGIIGAGRMAAVLAQRWVAAGHEVMIGARDAERGKALAARLGPDVPSGTLRDAAVFGEVALLAIWPTDVIPALLAAGAADGTLAGRTLIDCNNPVETDVFLADCPARTTLDLVAGTWSVVVVFALREGPMRHAELLERIGGISKKVLTQTLRRLEGSGLVRRRAIRSAPPGAEYALTGLGESLVEPVTVLARWAEQHAEQVAAARDGAA